MLAQRYKMGFCVIILATEVSKSKRWNNKEDFGHILILELATNLSTCTDDLWVCTPTDMRTLWSGNLHVVSANTLIRHWVSHVLSSSITVHAHDCKLVPCQTLHSCTTRHLKVRTRQICRVGHACRMDTGAPCPYKTGHFQLKTAPTRVSDTASRVVQLCVKASMYSALSIRAPDCLQRVC